MNSLYFENSTMGSLFRIRRKNGIEHMVNLVSLVHSSLKMLPYLDDHLVQALRKLASATTEAA